MIINTFTPAWWIMFAVQIALIIGIWLGLRSSEMAKKKKFMTGYWIFMVIFLIVYKFYLIVISDYETSFLNELPLNLCQVASLIALPGILADNKVLKSFSAFVGTMCSLMGLLMPVAGFYDIPLLSGNSIGFYGFHGLVFVQSVSLFTLGIYKPKAKDIPGVMILLAVFALIAHGCNYLLRLGALPGANYFFTYDPEGNPILLLLRKMIDINYVYELPLIIPIGLFFALITLFFRKKKA